jgi:alpha-ribazole phosphatase
MAVILIRHTRLAGVAGLCYGRADVRLAETFAEEAAAVRASLPWIPGEVRTSPAARCRALAEMLGCEKIVLEPRAQELHMGAWEGRRWEEFRGFESEAWALDPWRLRPPGGESAGELWARVAELRGELLARRDTRVAVVTHAGVIRAWRGIASGRGFEEMMREPAPFGSIWQEE